MRLQRSQIWKTDTKCLTIVFSDGGDIAHAEVPNPITIPWTTLKPLLPASSAQPQ